ncbi:hypothetical protein, partial [Xanthomonas citri]|uniref:hypothetical protein n=1 Tax=Xanthomonas citri TaxID=346 RepID=UPI001A92AF73
KTMRTERSTTSGENFGDFLIAPFSNEGASSKTGAVHLAKLGIVRGIFFWSTALPEIQADQ